MTEAGQLLEWLLLAVYMLTALAAAGHALLNKRDPRSAWGWIAVCWLFPLAGPVLYFLFGINRLNMTALPQLASLQLPPAVTESELQQLAGVPGAGLRELLRTGAAMSGLPLVGGNRIEPFDSGDQAYAAMLAAIEGARHDISLSTYIYLHDASGERFAAALAAAQRRGVQVRILLDGYADIVYRPRASRLLAAQGLRCSFFLPPRLLPPMMHINLRNHRKLLLVDGDMAFTGGMNIADYHRAGTGRRVQDLHFRLQGPIVSQLGAVFAADWQFATGETLPLATAACPCAGDSAARVVRDGPDDPLDRIELLLQGAMATAHQRIWIMTPYLVPTAALLGALKSAALRGIDVSIMVPEKSDQPWMDWATRHLLWQLLQYGVRVYWRQGDFAHAKLLLVDDYYLLFGSANLDNRSMRLNYELVVEAYDPTLVARLAAGFRQQLGDCRPATLEEERHRPLAARLRDGFFWLFSPFL